MVDGKNLKEAKRIMARMLSVPPMPHKSQRGVRNATKAGSVERALEEAERALAAKGRTGF